MSCVRPEGQQRDEKGISVRAGGIYGDGMARSMETEAAKVSNMMVQLSGISGDAIGVVKNFSKAMEWNPRGAENGFDLQGGLCNLVGGVPGIMCKSDATLSTVSSKSRFMFMAGFLLLGYP